MQIYITNKRSFHRSLSDCVHTTKVKKKEHQNIQELQNYVGKWKVNIRYYAEMSKQNYFAKISFKLPNAK